MSPRRFRDARAMHLAADRRRPFAVVNPRAAEPNRISLNRACVMILIGLAIGMLITFICTGRPY